MNIQSGDCDLRRIDEFLSADRAGLEEDHLLAHLDVCAACREYMETRAADADNWADAAELLKPGRFDYASSTEYSLASTGCERVDQSAAATSIVDSLLPSDDPARIGRLGNYEVTGVKVAGGSGLVLTATDTALDRVLALHVLADHPCHR